MASPLEGKLEPEARTAASPEQAALTSIAVSMKRIADAVTGDSHNSGILDFARDIAAGRRP